MVCKATAVESTMYSSTLREINEVRQMSVGQLRAKWRELYGEDTRSRNRDYLFRRLAWRLQELQHGGLSDRAKERIEELAPDRFVRARTPIVAPSVSSLVERVEHRPVRDPRLPSPGTVIVKLIREVHTNTAEGMWTTVRNFLRPFRGVHKKFLSGYIAICEFGINLKRITRQFISQLVTCTSS